MFKREFWRHYDFWLLGLVLILSIFGIVMVRSAIAGNAELEGSVNRQATFVALGMGVILVVSLIDYHYWASLSRVMYIGTILFLLVIFIIGEVQFGSARRLDLGLFFVQPSELAKIIMILVLADFYARTRDQVKDMRWILQGFLMTFGVVVWIMLQPNLSTSIVLIVIWFSMMWISGLPIKYLVMLVIIGILGIMLFLLLISLGVQIPFIEEYQIQRVVNFMFPDPNARHGDTYNVEQALITIGSGGWFGQGYGQGTQVQLRYLKVRHTDFIFSAMAAEFGFIGTSLIIGLLVLTIIRCFQIAKNAADHYGALIAYGFGVLLFFQTIVNIGVNLNVIPVTGLTLPFISYGGSSLLSLVLGIGFVESVAARRKTPDKA
ncbi:MAG: rod shape-determining protein RodA [Anaerolineae bacterium]|nr:rod shape-determining protein RodA [Anaerolineae bacterium]